MCLCRFNSVLPCVPFLQKDTAFTLQTTGSYSQVAPRHVDGKARFRSWHTTVSVEAQIDRFAGSGHSNALHC